MHPRLTFQLRPLAIALTALLALIGPCQLGRAWSQVRADAALVERGEEVMATVLLLKAGKGVVQQTAIPVLQRCFWKVRYREITCTETFALPCPEGVGETTLTYLPDDPSVCRVLSRAAIALDRSAASDLRIGGLIFGGATALLLFLLFVLPKRAPEAALKDP